MPLVPPLGQGRVQRLNQRCHNHKGMAGGAQKQDPSPTNHLRAAHARLVSGKGPARAKPAGAHCSVVCGRGVPQRQLQPGALSSVSVRFGGWRRQQGCGTAAVGDRHVGHASHSKPVVGARGKGGGLEEDEQAQQGVGHKSAEGWWTVGVGGGTGMAAMQQAG